MEVAAEPAVRRPASGAVRGREAAVVEEAAEEEVVVARYVPVGAARRDGGGDWRRVSSVSLMVLERPPGVGVGCTGGCEWREMRIELGVRGVSLVVLGAQSLRGGCVRLMY